MNEIGKELRRLRLAKDMSLREFGLVVGVSAAHISDIELGNRSPSDELLTKMAAKLDADYDDLRLMVPRLEDDVAKWISEDMRLRLFLRECLQRRLSGKDLLMFAQTNHCLRKIHDIIVEHWPVFKEEA